MRRARRILRLTLALAAWGCGSEAGDGPERRAGADTVRDPAGAAAGSADTVQVVQVWFARGERPVAVEREVRGGAPLPAALRELVAGPSAAERAAGIDSWFSESTEGALRAVVVRDARVVVDFTDLPRLIPGASSSAGSAALLASVDSTVFQFPWVEVAEYRLDGSCDAFWNWLQRGCHVVER